MLTGVPPFYHSNIDKMLSNVVSCQLQFKHKVSISEEAKDLISKVRILVYCTKAFN